MLGEPRMFEQFVECDHVLGVDGLRFVNRFIEDGNRQDDRSRHYGNRHRTPPPTEDMNRSRNQPCSDCCRNHDERQVGDSNLRIKERCDAVDAPIGSIIGALRNRRAH